MFRYTTAGKQTAFTVDELCIFNVVVVTYKESEYLNKKRSAHFPKLGFNFHSLPQLALIEMKIGIYCVKHCMAGAAWEAIKLNDTPIKDDHDLCSEQRHPHCRPD